MVMVLILAILLLIILVIGTENINNYDIGNSNDTGTGTDIGSYHFDSSWNVNLIKSNEFNHKYFVMIIKDVLIINGYHFLNFIYNYFVDIRPLIPTKYL